MMEAIRILKATDLQLDRTVRIALWGGEEEGLLGSRAYVKEHFADRETMKLTEQHAKISGYFNLDNGTGKIRGVYLQGNDMMRPIFETWLAPFKDLGVSTISPRNTGGTDHLSFDAVGIPGFQFIQDPMDYETRTHHSNMDVYDRIQPGDLMQASAIIASLVYDTANRPELLPRKPLPAPQPARRPMPTVTVLPTAAVTTPAAAKKARRRTPAPAAAPRMDAPPRARIVIWNVHCNSVISSLRTGQVPSILVPTEENFPPISTAPNSLFCPSSPSARCRFLV
jgi:Zn-dependent M28 family amino/carboxypeptidase